MSIKGLARVFLWIFDQALLGPGYLLFSLPLMKRFPNRGVVTVFLSLGTLGILFPYLWFSFLFLFLFSLSISCLHHKLHQTKRAIVEGLETEKALERFSYRSSLTVFVLYFIHITLFVSLILMLRQTTYFWGDRAFSPPTQRWDHWALYSMDLLFKALLFDIPEIYHIDFIKIDHVGFWPSTLVFVSRLVILVLILGALLRKREIDLMVRECLSRLGRFPHLAEKQILTILKLYPSQLKRLGGCLFRESLPPALRGALAEVLGKSRNPKVLSLLERAFSGALEEEVRISALRGMGFLGQGRPFLLEPLFEKSKDQPSLPLQKQACQVLASWATLEALGLLAQICKRNFSLELRLHALDSLGQAGSVQASLPLVLMVEDRENPKEIRFAAKDALVALGHLSPQARKKTQKLLESPFPDQRRFGAMVLGGTDGGESFPLLESLLDKERDPDALTRIIQALGEIGHRVGRKLEKTSERDFTSWKDGVGEMVKLAQREGEAIFVRMASIQAISDFGWMISRGILEDQGLVEPLQELGRSSNSQIADAASEALKRLAPHVKDLEFEERREIATAVYMEDLQWRRAPTVTSCEGSGRPSTRPLTRGNTTVYTSDSPFPLIPPPTWPSEVLERFEIQEMLGRGRISTVYKVLDRFEGSLQVMKILAYPVHPARELFLKEIEILEGCQIKGILPLLHQYQLEDFQAFTISYIDLKSLLFHSNHRKKMERFWSIEEILHLSGLLCPLLGKLHKGGWGHGDVKPENILYGEGELYLIDFNMAFSLGREKVDSSFRGGTPYYMAPEQMAGTTLGEGTDVYALGVLFYELLTGQLPMGLSPPPVHHFRPEVSPACQEVLSRATSLLLRNRFSSVEDFQNLLEESLGKKR